MIATQIFLLVQLTILMLCWGVERDCYLFKSLDESSDTIIKCWCNNSQELSEVMELWTLQPYHRLKTDIVDNNTIMAKLDMNYCPSSFFTCGWSAKWKSNISSIPFMNINNFVCRFHPNTTLGNCSFIDTNDWKSEEKEYFLISDGLPRHPCHKGDLGFVCNHIRIKDSIGTNTEFYGKNIDSCQWNLRPWNPKIRLKQRILPIHSKLINTFCLAEHLNAYQTFECHFSCRFKFHNAPWAEAYVYNYTTLASLPQRPPTIPLQGFYYDQEKRQLYIFWFHLDELEWNGANFTYIAKPDNEKISNQLPKIFGNMQAIFYDWDASLSTTIRIRSKNSMGLSANSSEIRIPILNKVQQQQPKNLQYNNEKQILSWDPPIDQDNLIGYTVFWCIDSGISLYICQEQQNIRMKSLNSSHFQLKFWNSMHPFNFAVAARYSDKIGGGMRWTGYRWIQANPPMGPGFSYYAAPIGVSALVILSIYLYKMCRKCYDIDVILPEGLVLDTKVIPFSQAEVIIPGNLSPEVVMDIKQLMTIKELEIKKEPQSVLRARINKDSQDTIKTTESYTKCSVKSTINASIATRSYSTSPLKSSTLQNITYKTLEFPKKNNLNSTSFSNPQTFF